MQKLMDYFNAGIAPAASAFAGSYNLAPTELAPIVTEDDKHNRIIDLARFGIKMTAGGKTFPLVNMQSEKAVNREDFKKRRCIIPADGFFEWEKVSAKDKQPYYFSAKDGLLSFAGVWRKEGEALSFSIFTTSANEVVSPVHARMPVILSHNGVGQWLAIDSSADNLKELMEPFPAGLMQAWRVSKTVNNARNKEAVCVNSL